MAGLVFLTAADIRVNIRNEFYNFLRDDNPASDDEIEANAESSAIAKMKSKLSGRFDVAAIFTATGPDRHPLILEYLVDIYLYRLHCRINPRKVPEHIKEKYNEALDWLDGVMDGSENPDLPAIELPDVSTNSVRHGGSQAPKEHYY